MLIHQLFIKSVILLILTGLNPGEITSSKPTREQIDTIKIGLLIPDNKSFAARQGAELAIHIANEKNGPKGKHFSLVVKSLEGPWGTGSKQAVSLIFDDKVCAILGSHDGRNAHLVEQACTKSRIVFLSAWSGDPSLSKAFVPWFFNCVPDYNQQADAFVQEIYLKRKLGKIAVVSDNNYDASLALESFIKKSEISGKPAPLKLSVNSASDNIITITDQIRKTDIEALILFGDTKTCGQLLNKLKNAKIDIPVFGSLTIIDEQVFSEKDFDNVIFISPGQFTGSKAIPFKKDYQKAFGNQPGAVASMSFDGMNLLIDAISAAGTDRENIQKALLNMNYEGVTGSIKFDDKGKRKGTPGLMQIKNGIQVAVTR